MSTTARKARKRAGIPFTKAQKVGTPVKERSFVTEPVRRTYGDRMPTGAPTYSTFRSPKRAEAFIQSGGSKRGSSLTGRAAQTPAQRRRGRKVVSV